MNVSDVTAIITAVVAIAGLALSIYNFYISRRDRKPALIAKISNGWLASSSELSEVMLLLEIANSGEKKVNISSVEIAWDKKRAFVFGGMSGTRNIPFELLPGENANFWTPFHEFALTLRKEGVTGKAKLKACFTDALGSKYYSKPLNINVKEWMKEQHK